MTDKVTDVSHDTGEAAQPDASSSRLDALMDAPESAEYGGSPSLDRDEQQSQMSTISGWLRLLFKHVNDDDTHRRRLRELTLAIEFYPDAPANYVLRGELYLDMGMNELAAADFRSALTLAAEQIETERWGVMAQAMQDRAEAGLKRRIEGD